MFHFDAGEAVTEKRQHLVHRNASHWRFGFEDVTQEEAAGAEQAEQTGEVSRASFNREAVKTANVQDQVEGRLQKLQASHVTLKKVGGGPGGFGLAFRRLNRLAHKVHPRRLPAMLGEINHIRARATAQIEGAAWPELLHFDKLDQLRRRDVRVPARAAEPVGESEEEAAHDRKKVYHARRSEKRGRIISVL